MINDKSVISNESVSTYSKPYFSTYSIGLTKVCLFRLHTLSVLMALLRRPILCATAAVEIDSTVQVCVVRAAVHECDGQVTLITGNRIIDLPCA